MRSLRAVPLVLLLLVLVVATWVPAPAPVVAGVAGGWRLPVQGDVLRLFAVGADRYAAGQHRGIDLAAPPGTPVHAACAGRVSFAGHVPRGGRTVSVRCGRLVATYQHLRSAAVRRGQVVAAGGPIGSVGRARPRPHVHLGARLFATGAYVDPLALLSSGPGEGPPPATAPARRPRPRPLVPSPELRAPLPAPLAPAREVRAPLPRPAPLPWPVWLGLGLVGLGLPLGGLVSVRRRRRRRIAMRAPVPAG